MLSRFFGLPMWRPRCWHSDGTLRRRRAHRTSRPSSYLCANRTHIQLCTARFRWTGIVHVILRHPVAAHHCCTLICILHNSILEGGISWCLRSHAPFAVVRFSLLKLMTEARTVHINRKTHLDAVSELFRRSQFAVVNLRPQKGRLTNHYAALKCTLHLKCQILRADIKWHCNSWNTLSAWIQTRILFLTVLKDLQFLLKVALICLIQGSSRTLFSSFVKCMVHLWGARCWLDSTRSSSTSDDEPLRKHEWNIPPVRQCGLKENLLCILTRFTCSHVDEDRFCLCDSRTVCWVIAQLRLAILKLLINR